MGTSLPLYCSRTGGDTPSTQVVAGLYIFNLTWCYVSRSPRRMTRAFLDKKKELCALIMPTSNDRIEGDGAVNIEIGDYSSSMGPARNGSRWEAHR
jgi:hypothetical protein